MAMNDTEGPHTVCSCAETSRRSACGDPAILLDDSARVAVRDRLSFLLVNHPPTVREPTPTGTDEDLPQRRDYLFVNDQRRARCSRRIIIRLRRDPRPHRHSGHRRTPRTAGVQLVAGPFPCLRGTVRLPLRWRSRQYCGNHFPPSVHVVSRRNGRLTSSISSRWNRAYWKT
jgi:hypothetical protein